jgi:ribosomal protein L11 methyltransferase
VSSEYFVVHLKNVSDAAEEWLSSAAFEFGALGMSEPLAFDQPEGEEDVFTRIPDQRAVDIYFQTAPAREFIEDLRTRFPDTEVRVAAEQERDWLAEWKKSFQPFALVNGHWVVPSWCEPPPQAQHKIWIDPGMAFGTGTHETTQLVAEALVEILPPQTATAPPTAAAAAANSALDVGTGTGILAILARQLGVAKIAATEIEPEARGVARENFERNQCADVAMNDRQVQDLTEKFDIVMANIIDGVLVRIQNDLLARVKPGGWLVLSGIITEREKDFLEGFQIKTWDLRRQKGDWLLYAVKV